MEKSGLYEKFYKISLEVVSSLGLSLYDLEYNPLNRTLRIFIIDEKTGSATLDDCAKVDRAITPLIEETEWVPESLILEVSSPGVYRALKTKEHFERVIGQKVSLTLFSRFSQNEESVVTTPSLKKILGSKKITANLVGVSETGLSLEFKDFKFALNHDEIKKANLEV